MRMQKSWSYYTFLLIPIITVLIFISVVIVPFVMGIGYTFVSWDGIPNNPKTFVGLSNYIGLFSDKRFLQSAWTTIVFTFFSLLLTNGLGLLLSLAVTSGAKTQNAARTMFFAPYLIGGLLLGFIWKFVFASPMVSLGKAISLEQFFYNWLLKTNSAMVALVLVNAWKMAGYIMILFIAGLQNIPTDVLESAEVDGANKWRSFLYIKLPLLAPSITVTTFLTLSNSFKVYDVNLSLTGGDPSYTTEMFAMNIYNEIFKNSNFGYGQAKAMIFFLFVALITLTQTYFNKRKELVM